MQKYIELPKNCLIPNKQHKLVKLTDGNNTVSFVRGKQNILLEDKTLKVIFSSQDKPVKIFENGRLKPGPKPIELAKDFKLELKDYKKPPSKNKYVPPKSVNISLERQIADCVLSVQRIIPRLPDSTDKAVFQQLQTAVLALKRLQFSLKTPQKENEKTALAARSQASLAFAETVRFSHGLKRR